MALSLAIALLSARCGLLARPPVAEPWTRIDLGVFSFLAPADMERIDEGTPIDSLAGSYRNGELSVSFDYGWYTPTPRSEDAVRTEQVTIDGKPAVVAYHKPGSGPPYLTAHFERIVPSLGDRDAVNFLFSVGYPDERLEPAARRIVDSLEFEPGVRNTPR